MDRWSSARLFKILSKKSTLKYARIFYLGDSSTYIWKHERETVPDHLWCPKGECNPSYQERVMLNLVCSKGNSLVCLGTRDEWKPAPYICKRARPRNRKY